MALLRGEGLTKKYGAVTALSDVTVEIQQGDIVVVLGPSGSGKTTLLNLLAILDRPSSGRVFLNGQEITHLPDPEAARLRNRNFGFVFQFFHLLPELTVRENVFLPLWIKERQASGLNGYRRQAEELLARFDLLGKKNAYPAQLSGGEMQRVAICRSLICQPQVVFADEPTGSIDRQAAASLLDLIGRLNQQQTATFVIATHNEIFLQIATKVVYLKDGRIERTEKTKIT
ncbi:MAG TPA: ABC transporter ATP-binding protein [bacterium]|nr:ABC transporter ATP-binding protein [bacterium]HOL67707.1 ABC transporter ATP-binding protein [bacterium]HPP11399.1 ABC transporter ATP-binding protein [bacterium]